MQKYAAHGGPEFFFIVNFQVCFDCYIFQITFTISINNHVTYFHYYDDESDSRIDLGFGALFRC